MAALQILHFNQISLFFTTVSVAKNTSSVTIITSREGTPSTAKVIEPLYVGVGT